MRGSSDFTPLGLFEREYYLFNMVSQLSFFRKYRKWKTFSEWKRNIRAKKTAFCKRKLEESLFVLNPTLRDAIIQFRKMCCNVEKLKIFAYGERDACNLDTFCDLQSRHKENVTRSLEKFINNVKDLVENTCKTSLEKFLEKNGFGQEQNARTHGGTTMRVPNALTASLDTDQDDKDAQSYTKRAATRTQCRKLTKYIRLVDFFMIDTFLSLALNSAVNFLEFINPPQKTEESPTPNTSASTRMGSVKFGALLPTPNQSVSPLFLVKLHYEQYDDTDEVDGELVFTPDATEFKNKLEAVIFDALKVVTTVEPLLTDPDFEDYTQADVDEGGPIGEGIDLEAMIVEDTKFRTVVEKITQHFVDSFDNAERYAELFEEFQEKFQENENMDVEQEFQGVSIEDFGNALNKFKSQIEQFAHIPVTSDVGIIRLDSILVKKAFEPSPLRSLRALVDLLPKLAKQMNEDLFRQVADANEKLSAVPSSVDHFVEIMSFLQETAENFYKIEEQYRTVKQMYELLKEHEISVNEIDLTNHFMLTQSLSALRTSMSLCEQSADDNAAKFSKQLEDSIPTVRAEIEAAKANLQNSIVSSTQAEIDDVLSFLYKAQDETDRLIQVTAKNMRYQEILKVEVQFYDELEELKADLSMKKLLWESLKSWTNLADDWCSTPFNQIDAEEIERQVKVYTKSMFKVKKGLENNPMCLRFEEMVVRFKTVVPVLQSLRNPTLQDHHWEEIHSLVGHEIRSSPNLSLLDLMQMNVNQHADVIAGIATQAVAEATLEEMLNKVSRSWETTEFVVNPYRESKDYFILGSVEEIVLLLDDSLVTINTILGSRYVSNVREEVESWKKRLVLVQETLDEWLQCQRQWMYLETIFGAPDIQRQLPEESHLFDQVNASWREVMKSTHESPTVIKAATKPGLKEQFQKHNASLDKIQKKLEDYLENKRDCFPRFYFLSNDELLQILAQSRNPQAVQPHLRKCFDNIVALEMSDGSMPDITAMISSEGEHIALGPHLKARGGVEEWLMQVQINMQQSLYKLMKVGIADYDANPGGRKGWVLDHPAQIVTTVAHIMWARGTEASLTASNSEGSNVRVAMQSWFDKYKVDISDLVALVRSNLTKIQRKAIVALIIQDVHARDIINKLLDDQVSDVNNFIWQQQLRYYWDAEIDDVLVHQASASIRYGYEYQGAESRLVITPLTDRCWITITSAIQLKLGAAPSGPAGTGKTEVNLSFSFSFLFLEYVVNNK